MNDFAWMNLGACKGVDPALFFPERGEATEPAKEVCARCPVKLTCLQFSLDSDEQDGVWGGMSGRERRLLKRKMRRVERPLVEWVAEMPERRAS